MAVLPTPNLDYTDKDFDSLNARLDSLIDQTFPSWTDRNRANFGNLLKEMFAYVLDYVMFYQDNQAKEAFFLEATQRKNLIALAKRYNFIPFGASAAEVDVVFTLGSVPLNDVTIDANTIVKTREITDPIQFRLLEDVVIAAGTNPPVGIGTVRNSFLRSQSFQSNGLPNQEFDLGGTPFIDGSEAIAAGNGLYTTVNNFLSSRQTDRHNLIVVDQNDRATVRFGNGRNGEIPAGTIDIDYEVGGGSTGNIEPGSITRVEGSFQDAGGNTVQVSVTNLVAASGGLNRQSNASIKEQAPLSNRVQTRVVAREDYEIAALTKVPAVARALHLTSDQDPSIAENRGILFVLGDGGGDTHPPVFLSQSVKDSIASIFTTRFEDGGLPKTVTFQVDVFDGVLLPLNILAVVYLQEGANPAATKQAIVSDLQQFFAVRNPDGSTNTRVDFGFNLKDKEGNPAGEIALSTLFNVVHDASGVRKIGDSVTEFTVNGDHRDIPILLREFPTLGTVTLIDGDTGQELPDE